MRLLICPFLFRCGVLVAVMPESELSRYSGGITGSVLFKVQQHLPGVYGQASGDFQQIAG